MCPKEDDARVVCWGRREGALQKGEAEQRLLWEVNVKSRDIHGGGGETAEREGGGEAVRRQLKHRSWEFHSETIIKECTLERWFDDHA